MNIAYSSIYELILVTDDTDMITLADDYSVKVIKTLELIKIMLDDLRINEEKVVEILEYWEQIIDYPKNCEVDFQNIFHSLLICLFLLIPFSCFFWLFCWLISLI